MTTIEMTVDLPEVSEAEAFQAWAEITFILEEYKLPIKQQNAVWEAAKKFDCYLLQHGEGAAADERRRVPK